jgi:hypothetical protein
VEVVIALFALGFFCSFLTLSRLIVSPFHNIDYFMFLLASGECVRACGVHACQKTCLLGCGRLLAAGSFAF